jgi:4-amino-4-deoxy-L-arabinose transferase-like glycosyltransferase
MFKQTLSSKARELCASQDRVGTSHTDAPTEHRDRTNTVIGRRNFWLLLLACALMAVAQVVIASRSGLWADEIFSLAIATGHSLEHPAAAADRNLGDFVERDSPVRAEEFQRYLKHETPPANPARVVRAVFLSDTNPPLYYLLLYGWTLMVGTSDMGLRSFSIACSLACLPLLAGVARRTGGKAAIFASCVLFACSPLSIYYSTEGRMYSLLWLCVLATTWTSLVLYQRGGSIGLYALWIVASTAGFLTHYFFLFPWLAIVAYLLMRRGELARRHLATCVLLTAILILPWYLKLSESLSNWRITQGWLKVRPPGFNRLGAFFELISQFFSWQPVHHAWIGYRISYISALILFSFVGVLMLWRLRFHLRARRVLLLWLLFAGACAGPLVFDLVQHTYTVAFPRYAIAALPAAYVLAAVGLSCLGRRARLVMLVLIVLTWAPNVLSIYFTRSRIYSAPIREISRAASANGSPADLILLHSIPSGVLGIARYASGPAPLASWVGQLGTRRVPQSIHTLATGRRRVLFVKVHDVGEPAPEEQWLRANALVFKETRVRSARIVDFRPIGSKTF